MYRLVPLIMKGATLCLAREERSTALRDTKCLGREAWLTGRCAQLSVWAGDAVHYPSRRSFPLWAGRAGVEGSAEAVGLGGLCDQSTLTQGTSDYCSVLHTCPWHDISTNSDQ